MKAPRGYKTACLPFESEEHHQECLNSTHKHRQHLQSVFQHRPELFPPGFEHGFTLRGTYSSVKQGIDLKRIKLKISEETYQIRPSFLMPYMVARTDEVEKGLYLRQWGVPFDALAYVFGHNPMFWYRATMAMGRPSLVGTTVKSKDKLPAHVLALENTETGGISKDQSYPGLGAVLVLSGDRRGNQTGLVEGREVGLVHRLDLPGSVLAGSFRIKRRRAAVLGPFMVLLLPIGQFWRGYLQGSSITILMIY